MAKIKQVNTLLKLLHLYLSIYYSILLQKNNNHWKNAVVWFRPSVFCKKIIKKERNFTGFVVYRRILLQKKTYNESKTTYYDVLVGWVPKNL